ncbi:uncharacterized protein LOC126576880 [Anopheles aquasalis]|uniref:uncharacterized protein LOC126576880 n=1 Tax=Anopheles aquasalis TaxID=42839 RepID=UPI00215A5C86|nr:uncharacterized protein LOC126576880 [Anopheles aquasalis]
MEMNAWSGFIVSLLYLALLLPALEGVAPIAAVTDPRPVRSTFSRSLDVLRVRGNQFVRGIPCGVACEFCGCEGTYISEKCVCFCPDDDEQNTECLTAIRKDELRAGIDNDILILSRGGARFARDVRLQAPLRARMGRGASVSWKGSSRARPVNAGSVKIKLGQMMDS